MMNMHHRIIAAISGFAPAIAICGMALAQVEAPSDTEAHAAAPEGEEAMDVPAPGEITPDNGFAVEAAEITFPVPDGYRPIGHDALAADDLAGRALYGPAGEELARLADTPLQRDGVAIEGPGGAGQALLPRDAVSFYRNDDGDLRAYTSLEAEEIVARLQQGAAE